MFHLHPRSNQMMQEDVVLGHSKVSSSRYLQHRYIAWSFDVRLWNTLALCLNPTSLLEFVWEKQIRFSVCTWFVLLSSIHLTQKGLNDWFDVIRYSFKMQQTQKSLLNFRIFLGKLEPLYLPFSFQRRRVTTPSEDMVE